MRALFLALILANLVFFFWEYTLAPERSAGTRSVAPLPDDAPPLVLLPDHPAPASASKPSVKAAPKRPPEASAGPSAQNPPSPGPPPVAEKAPALEPPALTCYIIGPFHQADAAQAAVTVLKGKRLGAGFEQRSAQKNRYWVHTPVQPDRKAALVRMKETKDAGIRDYALMRTGDFKNSISLGFYYNDASATRRLAALKAKQIDAIVETQRRTVNTYWVRYKAPKDSPAAAAAWATITTAHPKAQREGIPCR